MHSKKVKIILDTNLWISFLISRNLSQLDSRIKKGNLQLIFSEESLAEFLAVASRTSFRKYFSNDDILSIIEYIDSDGIIVEVKSKVEICRDPKDNFLLALAKETHADYLIAGDKDLLSLKVFGNTSIITFRQFLNE